MSVFGRNLRRIRADKGIKAKDLADAVGVAGPQVSRWERQGVTPEAVTVQRIADYLHVEVAELLGSDQPRHTGTRQSDGSNNAAPFDRDISRGYKKDDVPVVGYAEASADGLILWSDEGVIRANVDRFVSRSFADGDPLAYALEIRGDSMVNRMFPGEIVIAQPRLPVIDGCFAHVQLVDGERMVKRVFRRPGGWVLRSMNDMYPAREVDDAQVLAIHRIKHIIAP